MLKEQTFLQRGEDDHEDMDYFGKEGERERDRGEEEGVGEGAGERKGEGALPSVFPHLLCLSTLFSAAHIFTTTS